ncbi:hypothetical protein LCGC14_0538770 [marine sediment metagenome]|uniref:Terminase small subunit n=1 Tax=marine sediment metagenome TaxID=412755 RepID=A0A0F9SBZ9_9ZZZZ
MTRTKTLSAKHNEFINNLFLLKFNGTKAYAETYPDCSGKTAEVNSCKLLSNTKIKAEIERRTAELAQEAGWNVKIALKHLKKIIDLYLHRPSAAVSAIVAANRMFGMDKDAGPGAAGLTINVTTDRKVIESKEIENE